MLSQSLGADPAAAWRLREDISETLSRWHPYKNDISVAISRMPAFIEQVEALVRREYAAMEVVWYGHIGDGNLHLNILKPDGMAAAQFTARCAGATRSIATLLGEFGGSISAEHGVGLLKKDYLCCTRSAGELQLLRRVKDVFDPLGIMNPGKVSIEARGGIAAKHAVQREPAAGQSGHDHAAPRPAFDAVLNDSPLATK